MPSPHLHFLLTTPSNKTQLDRRLLKEIHCMFVFFLKMEKMSKILMAESFVRILAMVLASAAAILVGLDAETKKVIFIERRAYVKDLEALWVVTIIASVAAGYQFLQLCRCLAFAWLGKNVCSCNKFAAWLFLLFDQGMSYATFAGGMAAAQGSLVGLTGVKQLQWEKLCNIYTKFCVQAAIGIVVCVIASVVMAVTSSLSAYHLFRLYPFVSKYSTHVSSCGFSSTALSASV